MKDEQTRSSSSTMIRSIDLGGPLERETPRIVLTLRALLKVHKNDSNMRGPSADGYFMDIIEDILEVARECSVEPRDILQSALDNIESVEAFQREDAVQEALDVFHKQEKLPSRLALDWSEGDWSYFISSVCLPLSVRQTVTIYTRIAEIESNGRLRAQLDRKLKGG